MELNFNKDDLNELLDIYKYDDDIMCEDEPEVRKIKWAIEQLPTPERIIFLLQVDKQSQRQVGKLLGVSHSTLGKEFNKIKDKVLDLIK